MIISTNTHNHTHVPKSNQANFKNNLEKLKFKEKALDYFSLTAKLRRKWPNRVMDFILFLAFVNARPDVKVSQQTLIRVGRLHLCDRQLKRIIKDLVSLGFITRSEYKYRKVSTYSINLLFFDKEIRLSLKHLLKNLDDKVLARKQKNYEAKKKSQEEVYNRAYEEEFFSLLGNKDSKLNKYSLADKTRSDNSFSISNFQKMSPISIKEIYTYTHEAETDDGVVMVTEEPDWLVAAGTPIDSSTASGFKENRSEIETVSLSLNSFLKNSSSVPEQQVSVMKHETLYSKNIIAVVDQLKSVRPTIWGQIKMSAYPDEAILYADQQLLKAKKDIRDRFGYFMKVCKSYCDERGLDVKWAMAINLGKQYSMPANGPWIDELFVADRPVVAIKSIHPSQTFNPQANIKIKEELIRNAHLNPQEELAKAEQEMRAIAQNNPMMAFILGDLLKNIEKKETEKPEDRPVLELASDNNRTENIMSKSDPTHIKSFLANYMDQPVTKLHNLMEDYSDQCVTKLHDLVEDYDLLGVYDPFGDKN
ncbi:hypothetical protein [Methylobacter sp.]|uniref:hypothetical protein n=1 Tax=Methylobacter sp. TaxID=2051955 RepID=UPI003DA2517A